MRDQLLSSCSEELAYYVRSWIGDQMDTKTEQELLSKMHHVAVMALNYLPCEVISLLTKFPY